ncbi:hypothetical protein Dda_8874 [Drechslerella dactyloides]|uniref:Prion-inhibition and propagation HeLo domain-containing protein n=1 Tax=Drechslerella dactyloides TaxID=74499 RepID=A0AAD6NFN2_DREDA|nr:hypothetical protein Dda_8874 [Drechslerella dactyloides]
MVYKLDIDKERLFVLQLLNEILVAEVATAIGIAGAVGVLQSLLQCYKDFLTARDFDDDYAILQLRAALLENSTTTWSIAVGLIDESEAPRNEFLVARPTESNVKLVQQTLTLIRDQLNAANDELETYTTLTAPSPGQDAQAARGSSPLTSGATAASRSDDTISKRKRVANKIHRMVRRQHDEQHPGTLKRTVWALVDKARLENVLNKVTTLVDRLNTDFAPLEKKKQLTKCCEDIQSLKLSEEELKAIEEAAVDKLSQNVFKILENERLTGNKFIETHVAEDGSMNIGDYYDNDWKGNSVVRQQSRNDTYESLSVKGTAFVNIGDTFGGKSAVQIRLEQMQAARMARNRDSSD